MLKDYIDSVHDNPTSSINRILISGRILSKFEGRDFVKITVGTKSKSDMRNFPVIYAFKDENGTTIFDEYMLHDYISVSCHISSNEKSRENNESSKQQQIVADSIKRHIMSNGKYIDQNSVRVKGIVKEIHKDKFTSIMIDTTLGDGKHNLIRGICFGNRLNNISEGDECELKGFIRTKRKIFEKTNKKPIYYQDFVITRLVEEEVVEVTENESSALDELDMLTV